MLAAVLDTNAVHRDPWLANDAAKKLLRLAEGEACAIVVPQVVVDELRRQRFERAQAAHDLAAKGIEDMAEAGVDVTQTSADLASNLSRIASDLDSAFLKMLARPNVMAAPVPNVAAADLLKRDLERRRPFMEIEHGQKTKSVGFRDVLIWETVLEVLASESAYSIVLFVTSDKGFLSDDLKELHPDLLSDLASNSIEVGRVATVKNVAQAISEVEAAVERAVAAAPKRSDESSDGDGVAIAVSELAGAGAPRAELVTAATDALYALANQDVSMQMTYGGDYDYPEFVKFTMPPH